MKCDICNRAIDWADGFVLTTEQVVYNQKYWEFALTHAWASYHNQDPDGENFYPVIERAAAQSTGWLVCEKCSTMFDFDRHVAKKYAIDQVTHPYGSKPEFPPGVAPKVRNAWYKVYGTLPRF
jgi:hypothetical protein